MAKVVKKIRGRRYVYLQRSYRDGTGKVKTESTYLGPVSIVGEPRPAFVNLPEPTSSSSGDQNRKSRTVVQGSYLLDDHKISVGRVEAERFRLEKVMRAKGMGNPPEVRIRMGVAGLRSKKTSKGYTVLLPLVAKNTTRNRVRREILRCYAMAGLDGLKQSDEQGYDRLRRSFKEAQKKRNRCLSKWWKLTESRRKRERSVAMRMGNALPFRSIKGNPENVGLVEKRRLKGFRDEYASIYAKIQSGGKVKGRGKHGWKYLKNIAEGYGKAEAAVRYLDDPNARKWKEKKIPGKILRDKKGRVRKTILGQVMRGKDRKVRVQSKKKMNRTKRLRELKRAKQKLEATKQLYRMARLVEKTHFSV